MRASTKLLILAALLAAVTAPAAYAKTAAELLREGLYVEEVEGDLDKAIDIYQQIILDTSAPKNLVAQALYRQGSVFLKKKQEPEARAVFARLVNEHGDQTELVAKVRPLLEELGNSDPAALMPPETIAYIEIGSPGRQVETIMNMLKGTPVEHALAALKPGGDWQNGGPGAMVRGFLNNPQMLAELRKIRGIGVGVMELAQNKTSAMIVLYPGKSDALMGVLRMILSSVGQAANPIEGMSVVMFGEGGGVAFDDTVVIAVTPSPQGKEMLQGAIQRHKGTGLPNASVRVGDPTASRPSLASANQSFTSISKQARQQNAVTLWLNVDETYGRTMKMLPPDQVPPQVHMANGFIDFQNVDDFIASLSLRETGVALDTNVNFKEGSKSMFYNLIRTPNLNRDALKAVPADAVALISLTLGGADTAQAQAASAKLKEATGLDIGPQIFGNVEQITLFAAPPKDAMAAQDSPIPAAAQAIGLAVTSKNPQQVHQLVSNLLMTAKLLPEGTEEAPSIPAAGRFDLTLVNNMKVFGYTDQTSKTMVISPSAQVVDTSITAMKQDASVVSGGKLRDALTTLPPATSKLVLLNVAGAIQLASQSMEFPSDEMAAEARKSLDELAQATQKTTVRLQTTEQDNSFSVRLSVSDLPPITEIVGPIQHLAQMVDEAKASVATAKAQSVKAACIVKASRPPEIDGNADDLWEGAESNRIGNVAYAPVSGEADLSASFKTMYDSQALYLLVDVTDDELINDSVEFWLDDGVEVFIDADNSKSETYGENDYQYNFSWDSSAPNMGETKANKTTGVQYAFARTDAGYRAEIKLPWSTLEVDPKVGSRIGLDVHVNDDDDGGDRDTKLMWRTKNDIAWQHPKALGTGELAGLIAWWRLDESTGTTASDSSGNGQHAALHGTPTWQPASGKINGAIMFDGLDDHVDTGYTVDLATWTVAAWVKSPAAPTSTAPSGPVHREKNFQINWNHPTDQFRGAAAVCIEGMWHDAGFGELKPDTWYHLVAAFDGKSLKAYKDGVLVTNNANARGCADSEQLSLKFGKHARDDYYFAGVADDVRLYNYGLPEAQVKELSRGR